MLKAGDISLNAEELKVRTKQFAIRIIKFVQALPKSSEAQVIGRQLLKSGTSVAANYRAVCRSRSNPEFIAKMGTVIEEADETAFWLELVDEASITSEHVEPLLREAGELVKIFAASRLTASRRSQKSEI
jgi:four helix bundle protein